MGTEGPGSGYGKGSGYGSRWKRYLLWYIVGAVVVYGLVYLLFFRDGGLY